VYGLSNLDFRVLGPDAMFEFHRISCKWHDLLGELHSHMKTINVKCILTYSLCS
jgi:hypothetical protein